MAKPRTDAFRCSECGWTSSKWVGRCGECQAWGTVAEIAVTANTGLKSRTSGVAPTRRALPVSEVTKEKVNRSKTGFGEFDRVIGGGLVPGQVVLVAGEPGVGKSTLLLAVAHHVAQGGAQPTVLYVSGEESVEQIGVRAQRIGATSERLLLADENDLATLLGHIEEHDPGLVVVDSVQTIASGDIDGRAGGVSQVVEVTQVLSRVAKSRRMPLLLVGQSTKQDSVAGPRALEHLVDTVLTFDGDRNSMLRLLRATKNRYGPADEIVCFEQADDGLREVRDPSDLFRAHRDKPVPGTCVTVTIEGRRPMLAEIQALVTDTSPAPRRGVTGLDSNRVAMLVAVTERAGPKKLGGDVFVATVGGAKISDPGSDLAVCIAISSAALGQPMPADVLAIGEVALSGDIRPVPYLTQRVTEAARLGYKRALIPKGTRRTLPRIDGIEYSEVAHLDDALARLRRLTVVIG